MEELAVVVEPDMQILPVEGGAQAEQIKPEGLAGQVEMTIVLEKLNQKVQVVVADQ